MSVYSGIPVLNANESINDLSSIHTKEKVLMLAIIQDKDSVKFKKFRQGRTPTGNFDGYSFYPVYVDPH